MKRILFLISVMFLFKSVDSFGISFTANPIDSSKCLQTYDNASNRYVYAFITQSPTYPGGEEALIKFLNEQTNNPKLKDIAGRVLISFIVEIDGKITGVTVKRGLSPEADKAAIEMIYKMPHWNPGLCKEEKVAVLYNIPISFRKH